MVVCVYEASSQHQEWVGAAAAAALTPDTMTDK